MMVRLLLDVILQRIHVRWTDRERPVSCLLMKLREVGLLRLDPFRRVALQFADQGRDFDRFPKATKNMNVVFRPAIDQRRTIQVLANAREIGVGAGAEVLVSQERRATLR